jgi:hypothetical protein
MKAYARPEEMGLIKGKNQTHPRKGYKGGTKKEQEHS